MPLIIRPDFKRRRKSPWYGAPTAPKRATRSAQEFPTWIVWCLVGVLLSLAVYLSTNSDRPSRTLQTASSAQIDVVDGDTVRTNGQIYRLVGFNTPESGLDAQCARALIGRKSDGAAATARG